MKRTTATRVSEPASALASYLDELLHTATSSVTEAPVQEPAPQPEARKPAPRSEPAVSPPPQPAPAPVVAAPEPEVVKAPAAAPVRHQEPPPVVPEVRPDWAHKPFECLIFKVAGLQLAVPLVLLGAIHRIEGGVRPIPGRPPWYMGMLPDRDQNLRVVDTAEWIMTGRVPAGARDNYHFVIRLDQSEWALACDEVAQSFTLDPDQVRWRSARSKRPWLAGTVIEHMCALIDVGTMARLLARAETEHRLELD